jgi:ATP-dependent DNA ligase
MWEMSQGASVERRTPIHERRLGSGSARALDQEDQEATQAGTLDRLAGATPDLVYPSTAVLTEPDSRRRSRGLVIVETASLSFVPTMQPTLVDSPPEGDEWVHEIKHDGYRTELLLNGSDSRAFTRNGHDWSDRYANILKAARPLRGAPSLLDGEIVVQNEVGASDFHAVRSAITSAPHRLVFFAFDLLMENGQDIRGEPLLERRRRLREIVGEHDPGFPVQFSDHIVGHGPEFFHQVEELGLEGIVSKLAISRYRSGHSTAWLKTKAFVTEELVVVGTERGIGPTTALCARETSDGLEYAGGAILTLPAKERERFWATIEGIRRPTPPVAIGKRKTAEWVEPMLRAQIRHLRGEMTLRHATVREIIWK